MTIKKGEAWGEPATPPAGAIDLDGDRAVSAALERARRDGVEFPPVVVSGGDLGRTLAASTPPQNRFTVDVGEALVDGVHHYFVAHAVARHSWRDAVVAMNAQWHGEWNLAPKGHPNDGRLDVTECKLQRFEWRKVRARLESGTHVPHPRIETRSTKAVSFDFPKPRPVFLDGVEVGRAKSLALRVIPDALTVYA